MIRLILVDDESTTRNGLYKNIPWTKLGVDIVEQAKDGLEAIKIMETIHPDILLSDIRMPLMNGIELATYVRKKFPQCKIIFLSGYSDKEYLKSAITLDVMSYIEKPINLNDVKDTIKKAVNLCLEQQENEKRVTDISNSLCETQPFIKQKLVSGLIKRVQDMDEVSKEMGLAGLSLNLKGEFCVVITHFDPVYDQLQQAQHISTADIIKIAENAFRNSPNITSYKDDHHVISIISQSKATERATLTRCLENLKIDAVNTFGNKVNIFITVGENAFGLTGIIRSYQTAVITLQKLFYQGYNGVVFYKDTPCDIYTPDKDIIHDLSDCLKSRDKNEVIMFYTKLCMTIKKHDTTLVNHIKELFFKLSLFLAKESEKVINPDMCSTEQEDYLWNLMSEFKTIYQLTDYMTEKTLFYLAQLKKIENFSRPVLEAIDYIEKCYFRQDLFTQNIAEIVYLAPTYLCALFKKEVGKTISEYITQVRIEKSKELLTNYHLKLYEIAKAVGYSDSNYFAKNFKKLTGITPSEYRERLML